jgi:hypothetical protein
MNPSKRCRIDLLAQCKIAFITAVFLVFMLSSLSWAQPSLQVGSVTGMPGETADISAAFANH